ncbi:MAG TPA: hypothetical protein DCP75_17315 [Haliea salexigens]|uniref:Uncharacterized protein n=4 Tax=Haliea salexigens TaxID=287487 RepID=A0A3C1KRZ0_9GAMM|nr:hypothetical protein [Haliea salexigens]
MLPVARRGLEAIGIAATESDRYLGIIEQRLASGQTGARWQLSRLGQAQPGAQRPDFDQLRDMLEAYRLRSESNTPVAEWTP